MIVKCRYCGNQTEERLKICPSCGAVLPRTSVPKVNGVPAVRKRAKRKKWLSVLICTLVVAGVTATLVFMNNRREQEQQQVMDSMFGRRVDGYEELMKLTPSQAFLRDGFYQTALEHIFNTEIHNITWDDIARIKYVGPAYTDRFCYSMYNSWDFERAEDFEMTIRTIKMSFNPNTMKTHEIAYFIGLEELDGSGQRVYEFDTGTLLNLKSLHTSVASNYERLKELTQLEYLEIYSSNGGSMEYLSELKNLKSLSLDRTDYRNLKALTELPNLESLKLGHNSFEWDIETIYGLQNLKTLELQANGIKSLEGLVDLGSLEELKLSELAVNDLSFISKLTNLKILSLHHMPYVTKLDYLSCPGLRELELDASGLADCDWIAGFGKLESLSLTGAKDTAFLEQLVGLRRLEVVNSNVQVCLGDFPELEDFTLSAPTGGVLDMDGSLEKLRRLCIENAGFNAPMDPLFAAPNLKELYITNSTLIFESESLGGLKQIERLTIKDCPQMADAVAFLPDMPQLTNLDLSGCKLMNLAFLNGAPKLISVNVSNNRLSSLLELENLPNLETAYIAGNPLKSRETIERLQNSVNIIE